jgi:hypothetical protein
MKNKVRKTIPAYCKAVEKQHQNAYRKLFDRDPHILNHTLTQGRNPYAEA